MLLLYKLLYPNILGERDRILLYHLYLSVPIECSDVWPQAPSRMRGLYPNPAGTAVFRQLSVIRPLRIALVEESCLTKISFSPQDGVHLMTARAWGSTLSSQFGITLEDHCSSRTLDDGGDGYQFRLPLGQYCNLISVLPHPISVSSFSKC